MPRRSNVRFMSSGTSSQLRLGFRAAAQIVADVVEDDVFQVLGRPMRRHGLLEEDLERLVAELPDPFRLLLDAGDVIDRGLGQTGAGVEGVRFGISEIAGAPVDVDVRFGSAHIK